MRHRDGAVGQLRLVLGAEVCDHVRVDAAGGDAVDADAGRAELLCQRLRESDDRALRGRVGHLARGAVRAEDGGEVDDVPGLFMHHRRDRAAAAVVHTRDVHIKQPLPDGRVEIRQQPVDRDAGVVHQQVHRSNLLEHGCRRPVALLTSAQMAMPPVCAATASAAARDRI